jgi:hypothetical protein
LQKLFVVVIFENFGQHAKPLQHLEAPWHFDRSSRLGLWAVTPTTTLLTQANHA